MKEITNEDAHASATEYNTASKFIVDLKYNQMREINSN